MHTAVYPKGKQHQGVTPIRIDESIILATQVMRSAGISEPRREAGSLLAHTIGKDRTFLITHANDELSEEDLDEYRSLIERRASGEPLQYIIGAQDFFGRQFRVTPDVLIPRPETELLVEAALHLLRNQTAPYVCDVGTGSGCISITLLCERDDARAIAVDISEAALKVARFNSTTLSVSERIEFRLSDCFSELKPNSQFDLVVSNPPYVAADVLSGLQREVRDHEPRVALSPGPDGLEVIQRLLGESPAFLKDKGHLVMEIGFDQGKRVQGLIDPKKWRLVEIRPDLQGIPRIVVLQRQ